MSLRALALGNKLPVHQFMDRETLSWIRSTGERKGFLISQHIFVPKAMRNVAHFSQPNESFFVDNAMYTGIHGFRHCARVALLAGLVCHEMKILDLDFVRVAIIAGSLHDCRRENDNADEGHGARSADWFKDNIHLINEHYRHKLSVSEIRLIDAAVRFHEIDQHVIKASVDSRYWQIINIIKEADALDRYRQPKEKWWINEDYLEIKPSKPLKESAFNLMYKLEDYYLETNDNSAAYELMLQELRYV